MEDHQSHVVGRIRLRTESRGKYMCYLFQKQNKQLLNRKIHLYTDLYKNNL